MAIRRPHKPLDAFDPPLDATDVFAIDTMGGTSPTPPTFNSGFITDFVITRFSSSSSNYFASRLTGTGYLTSETDNAEDSATNYEWDYMDGWRSYVGTIANYYSWMFKRAPGFMDVVTWTGTHLNRTVTHNLASTPEFIIVKRRSSTEDWTCYHSSLGNTKYIQLNGSSAAGTLNSAWNNTDPTSTNFTLGNHDRVNTSGQTYVAYLFATLPGISKVGSYTGNDAARTIDCGFTNGARFVLIKKTSAAGSWLLFDTTRGINAGNDPFLQLNFTNAQYTSLDVIDPHNSGFNLTNETAVNQGGQTYIFLAIA